jgi:DNA polymerase-1
MVKFIGNTDFCNSTMQECIEYLQKIEVIGIDIETKRKFPKGLYKEDNYSAGLDPYLTEILMLQVGDIDTQFIIDCRCTNISVLKPILEDETKLFVGHNLKFEAKHLKYNLSVNFVNIWDTMLVEMILTNGLNLGYGLARLADSYLGIKSADSQTLFNQFEEDDDFVDKSIRTQFVEWGDKPFTQKQIEYGKDDIIIPLKIRELQLKSKYLPLECIELENKFCLVLADIELEGLSFNKEQWLKVAAEKQIVYENRLKKINNWVIQNHKKFCSLPDLFNSETTCSILWSSSDQVVDFFKYLGFCPKEKSKQTKKLEYSVGAKALFKLLPMNYKELYLNDTETDIVNQEDVILNYLLLKKSEQAITTFGPEFLKYIHPITGKIHSSYKQILNTGRIASSKPNVQNIPSEVQYRMSFIPSEGFKIINADYASQESRVLAEVCGDADMLSFFNDGHPIFGDDYHSFVATKMFRIIRNDPDLIITKKTDPKARQDAKSINFKIAYGGSAFTLKDDFGVDEDVAQKFIDGYFEAIPSLKEDFEVAKKRVLELGYIEIDKITKRRWWWKEFDYLKELNKKIWSHFPDNYRKLNKEQKDVVKKELYEKHPEIKDMWSEYFSLQGKAERNALNYRIQGLSGSQTKKAGILFREFQLKNNLQDKIKITNLIHDECLAECQEDFVEEGRQIIENCMKQGAQYYCSKVKMEAEAVITDFWHH